VRAWFNLKNLKFEAKDIDYFSDVFQIKDWIEENINLFRESLEERLLQSFRYKEKNNQGDKAGGFLHWRRKYKLTVGEIEKSYLLVFSETY
jgi:hypothetical protein